MGQVEVLWDVDWVTPPLMWTEKQIENITFPHPSDADGNKQERISVDEERPPPPPGQTDTIESITFPHGSVNKARLTQSYIVTLLLYFEILLLFFLL